MSLDTKYIPINTFQEIFLDKISGCPLSGGSVEFKRDVSRIDGKDVFILSGTPPNYTYTNIGDTVALSSSGTFLYDGEDVTIYLYPYDDSGNIDLYYGIVKSSGGTQQITREAFPNISQEEIDDEELKNFVPNGQFLLHHNIIADEDGGIEAGEITEDVTIIAEGGWAFERTPGSTAKDFVLFERVGSFVSTPSKSPRYSARIKNESPGISDTFKSLTLTYRDVNKFASDTKQYTFAFQARNVGGSGTIEVKLIKNYGTGGSPQEETILQEITLGSSYQYYDIPFVFGSNDGKTIGDLDDDYVQLAISFPVSSVFDHNYDNVVLLNGDKQVEEFIDTTDAEFIRDSLAGWPPAPDYDGKNLYLPVRLGLKGFEYDTSDIGKLKLKTTENLDIGELATDGAKYRVAAYSSDRIPYRRLYEKWSSNSDIGLSINGTGENEYRFIRSPLQDQSFTNEPNDLSNTSSWQSFTAGNNNNLIAIVVKLGGTIPTNINLKIRLGEGINDITNPVLSEDDNLTLSLGVNTIYINNPFKQASGSKYTIDFTTNTNLTWKGDNAGGYAGGTYRGTAADAYFQTIASTSGAQSNYDLISNTVGSVVSAVDGATPTGFTFLDIVTEATQKYVCKITTVAASSMTAGCYFIYNTPDIRKYIPWFKIDGVGTKPIESAQVYILVNILSTDDAATVANKIAIAINSYSIQIPDYRGLFFRAKDDGAGIDPDAAYRTPRGDGLQGDLVGTIQQDENKRHKHDPANGAGTFLTREPPATGTTGGGGSNANSAMTEEGGNEARSKNVYVNAVIKY